MTTIFALLARASLLLLAAILAGVALRSSSASVRHRLWCLTLMALLALPILWVAVPRLPLPLLPAEPVAPAHAFVPTVSVAEAIAVPVSEVSTAREAWPNWVLLIWGAGVVLALGQLALGSILAALAVRRARPLLDGRWQGELTAAASRLGVRRPLALGLSDAVGVPIVWGDRAPTILVPPRALGWPDDRIRTTLLHELAHVARRDCATQTLAYVVRALYWPHPLVWWVVASLRREAEKACDDRVLAAGASAPDYARHLLDAARGLTRPTRRYMTAAAGAELTHLGERVNALLDDGRDRTVLTRRPVLGLACGSLVALLVLSAVEPVAVRAHPQNVPGTGAAYRIDHDPVGCLIEGRFPEIDARIEPAPETARLYFVGGRSADTPEFWVEMTRQGDRYVGILPRPQKKASPVRYRIEAQGADGRSVVTDRYHAVVQKEESRCPRATRVAPHDASVETVTVHKAVEAPRAEAPADPTLDGWIVHEAVSCLVAGRLAEIGAAIEPSSQVAEVRLYFGTALGEGQVDYWTEMPRHGARFVGRLPPPTLAATAVHYRIEARRTDGRLATTDRIETTVVSDPSGCPDSLHVAPEAAKGVVTVY